MYNVHKYKSWSTVPGNTDNLSILTLHVYNTDIPFRTMFKA